MRRVSFSALAVREKDSADEEEEKDGHDQKTTAKSLYVSKINALPNTERTYEETAYIYLRR